MDFRNFLSSKSEKIGFFEQFLVIFSMKEASNQKMVLENVVQNFMMNMILKKIGGLEDLKKSPGFKGLK